MKLSQGQLQGADLQTSTELVVELLARLNFETRNVRRDRAWSKDQVHGRLPALVLSDQERSEFMEQARHQLKLRRD